MMKPRILILIVVPILTSCVHSTVKQPTDSDPRIVEACEKRKNLELSLPTLCPGNIEPEYPLEARLKRIEGTVALKAYLNKEGILESVNVEKSSGSKLLDDVGEKTFRTWRYVPGTVGWVLKEFSFRLKAEDRPDH